jgi:hypothetical protein
MIRAWVVCCLCACASVAGAQEPPKPAAVKAAPATKEPAPKKSASKPAKASAAKEPAKAEATTKSTEKKTPPTKPSTTAEKSKPSSTSKPKAAPASKVTKTTSAAVPPVEPAPVAPAPPPPSAANSGRVVVPSTSHFHIDVPAGLQAWLDADDRMRPWLGKAVIAVDSCYADLRRDNPSASGVITFSVTMHQNARPSGAVGSLPAPLRSLVPCVTSSLWSVRMPLFTGDEGARYEVAAHFDP